ncbi:MAG: hypothetical protein JW957_06760 [Candidatus Omnitrophica bacterium]|nr:hypothetical protein [Candidatus Omnitrophota bacterium]
MSVVRKKGEGTIYSGENLNYIAFPMGGIGAGMICLEGYGGLTNVSLRHNPEVFNQPCMFSAFCIKGKPESARVLEGQIPNWKIFGQTEGGRGLGGSTFGFPRCHTEYFKVKFPFAAVRLDYPIRPQSAINRTATNSTLKVEVTGWSPFIPGDADNSSLPAVALEYTFINTGRKPVDGIYSFHAKNFLAANAAGDKGTSVKQAANGFVLHQAGTQKQQWDEGNFCASVMGKNVKVNTGWFFNIWYDSITMVWKDIETCRCISGTPLKAGAMPSPGGSIYVPVRIPAGGKKTVKLLLSWYVPNSNQFYGEIKETEARDYYSPWYAGSFKNIRDISGYWQKNYDSLKEKTRKFTDCFYKMSLPAEITDAIASNLSILKSPTVLRQADGRLWCWEGCGDNKGSCAGSCTHVWNYAQAFPHLFPGLERTLRETEFNENQDDRGQQNFRGWLPIKPSIHKYPAASDGQLGGIMKVYRDWRISGDTEWLKKLWRKIRKSLDYCIETWDPEHKGILQEPHHNTYDIEFWGPDGMCGSFYLGALKAACLMAEALDDNVPLYRELYEKGRRYLETKLFNGEYFYQDILRKNLKTPNPTVQKDHVYAESLKLIIKEGPKYQYGKGCLSDGVLGSWIGAVCGVDDILDDEKVKSHLLSVLRYNFRESLVNHVNPQRPGFALGDDGGLLLCTWPKGGKLSIPFPYSDEVWTGIEYQVASHLMMHKQVKQALEIIRTVRKRYDGTRRNPFDEYECGHWYGRALSSYSLLQGFSGIRYDAVDKTLHIKPAVKGDFSSFLCTAAGCGLAGLKKGKPFLKVCSGKIEVKKIEYTKP